LRSPECGVGPADCDRLFIRAGFDDVPAVYQVDDIGVKEIPRHRDPLLFAHTQFFSAEHGVVSTDAGTLMSRR
jgi:hypothetical protein